MTSSSEQSTTITYPAFMFGLFLFCDAIIVLMAFIGVMAYWQEGVEAGLWAAVLLVPTAVYLGYMLWHMPRQVQLSHGHIHVRYWGRTMEMPVISVTAVRHSRGFITLHAADQRLRLAKLVAAIDARLWTELHHYLPVLHQQRQHRLEQPLPIQITPKRMVPVTFLLVGLAMLVVLFSGIAYLMGAFGSLPVAEKIFLPFFLLLTLLIATFMLWRVLWVHAWQITITANRLTLRGVLRVQHFDPRQLTAVTHRQQQVTVRGFPRTRFWLELHFADGRDLQLAPNNISFPMDYPEAEQAALLDDLAAQLAHHFPLNQSQATDPSQTAASRPAPTTAARLHGLLRQIQAMSSEEYGRSFETLRDNISALGPAALDEILAAAVAQPQPPYLDLLVTILADAGYPPALPHFAAWLTHENDEVVFAAAMALDAVANGRFAIDSHIKDGWVQYDEIRALAPQMQTWWAETGQTSVPTKAEWLAARLTKPRYTEQEKRYNFIDINPRWVMQADGIVVPPQLDYRLPLQAGTHLLGGDVLLFGELQPRPAVFEVNGLNGGITAVYVKDGVQWRNVTHFCEWRQPAYASQAADR